MYYVLCAMCCVLGVGCVRQSLTIRTEPPGALVSVNDQVKGQSPVTYDFQWYGWHRVSLRKDGFERVEDRRLLQAPPHLWIPLDLVMELLPWRIRDDRAWSYTLTPTMPLPEPTPPTTFELRAEGSAPETSPDRQAPPAAP